MRALPVITLLAVLVLPPVAFAETQTFTVTHTYILGDHDSKEDARQRCLLEAKRKILEEAGVYIESASEVKNFDLTKDKITSFTAAVMQVKDTKENFGFENGHMTLTLTTTATVDSAVVRKLLAAHQVDTGMQERLKRLEVQIEAMVQRTQGGKSSGHAPDSQSINISAEDLQLFRTRAAQGNALALGWLYQYGQSVPQDYAMARQWYEQAAAQGEAVAKFALGVMNANGEGAPQDYAMARQWFEQAAAQGNASAKTSLGLLYYNGDGVPQDYIKARQWWEQAAKQGDAEAQYNLGVMYSGGLGVSRDYTKARGWYKQAAAQGNAMAQLNLGVLYDQGRGVPQDYAIAAQWYEQAAKQGDAEAQTNLGVMYFKGLGVSRDYAKARGWYEQAAAQGNAMAQGLLGFIYALGQGVPQNYVRGYMWLNLAAAHLTDAHQKKIVSDQRNEVSQMMTTTQIAEAQRLAQQCEAQQFKGCRFDS